MWITLCITIDKAFFNVNKRSALSTVSILLQGIVKFLTQNEKKIFVKYASIKYNIISCKCLFYVNGVIKMDLPKINGEEFQKITSENKETCVIIFSKESCSVCKQLAPVVEKVAASYEAEGTVKFYSMDVKTDDGLATFKSLQLMGVPQSVFFLEGEMKDSLPGALSESILKKEIENMIHPKTGFFGKLKSLFK